MPNDLTSLTIKETADGLSNRKFSSVEVVGAYLARIKKIDNELHSFLTVDEDKALADAKKADERRSAASEVPALLGVPLAIKDNIMTVGLKTTAASKMLADYMPSFDATVIDRLRERGAIILVKTNLD